MRTDPLFQQGDQFGLHEGVVVGDVEADDAPAPPPRRPQPRGRRLQARPTGEHPLGRRRAQAVTGAEEEEVGQEALNAMLDPL